MTLNTMNDIEIFRLRVSDSESLAAMLMNDPPEYSRYFQPFAYTLPSVTAQLTQAEQDRYWGIRAEGGLCGFFMLRGFDEGYQRPSFGVYIAQYAANQGLANLALRYCMAWCRHNQIAALMLKVHPDNQSARRIYEKAGFVALETDPQNDNLVMEKRWIAGA